MGPALISAEEMLEPRARTKAGSVPSVPPDPLRKKRLLYAASVSSRYSCISHMQLTMSSILKPHAPANPSSILLLTPPTKASGLSAQYRYLTEMLAPEARGRMRGKYPSSAAQPTKGESLDISMA